MAKTASIENEYAALDAFGGISRIDITDYHFAGEHVEEVAQRFNAAIYCSQIEAPKIRKQGGKSLVTFEYTHHDIEPNLSVIPTPGHTSGGVCYLLTLDNKRYLFTGDFLYFDGSAWVVGSKNYAKVKASLERLRDLDYDYLVGCGDDALGCPYIELTPETRKRFFEQLTASF
ncbi:MAG: MBL fold metallo-hydrolase [Chloroflexi bacterium]|nr:MBL fold metallo-hydrolase [Chloroflexota bacterium]